MPSKARPCPVLTDHCQRIAVILQAPKELPVLAVEPEEHVNGAVGPDEAETIAHSNGENGTTPADLQVSCRSSARLLGSGQCLQRA